MVRNDNYFYISGFLSLGIFLLFLTAFTIFMFSPKAIKNFALKKDNYISISVNIQSEKIPNIKQKPLEKSIVKESTPEVIQTKSIDDLFGDVWTKSVKIPKKTLKKPNTKRLQEISRKIKTIKKNNNQEVKDLFENINTTKITNKNKKVSTASEVNEYLARIQALVYAKFKPTNGMQGNEVLVVIELSAIGKLKDFRVLRYSSNSALNDEADTMRSKLLHVVFPTNPDNIAGTYKIKLIPEDKS